VNLFTPAAVADESYRLAVGRIQAFLIAGRVVGDLTQVACLSRRRKDLAVNRKRYAAAGRRDVVIVGLRVEIADLGEVLLSLGGDVAVDWRGLSAGDVELPDAEVVLEDDHFSVRADCGEAHITGLERSDAVGF